MVLVAAVARNGQRAYINDVRAEYARIAAAHARGEENKQRLSLADARANALQAQLVRQLSAAGAVA